MSVHHWTGGGTVPRDADGNIIWCNAPGPTHRDRVINCARVLGHDGDEHENGTFKWPRKEGE